MGKMYTFKPQDKSDDYSKIKNGYITKVIDGKTVVKHVLNGKIVENEQQDIISNT